MEKSAKQAIIKRNIVEKLVSSKIYVKLKRSV